VDVWEYFATRERECKECSLVPQGPFHTFSAAATDADGKRGIIWGRLTLTERSYVDMSELVVVRGSGITRLRYSYYLIIDDEEVWGCDRDPEHDPATHRHEGVMHKRFPCSSISFKEMAQKAWASATAHEELNSLVQDAD
jgi:hypothetical protein